MVQLGLKAATEQYPPEELLEYAIAAEEAGFDAVEGSDHFQPWSEDGEADFVWTWLGAVAARTRRIALGTGVTCPTLRYNPAIIAQASATLARLAPNRSFLAVGVGEALNEYCVTRMWPSYAERRDRLRVAIELIRALWAGEEVTQNGPYYQMRKARLWTLPREPLPIYIATSAVGSARFAGRYGDGMMTVGGQGLELYSQILHSFEQGAREAGKDPSRMPRLIELAVSYTDDKQGAIACLRKYWVGAFVPALFEQNIYTPKMSARNGQVVGTEILEQRVLISDNPSDHVRHAQQFIDLGFTHLYFHSAGPDQKAFIEGYGRDVLPHLRQSNA